MEIDTLQYRLLEDTVGIPIEIITNEFREIASNTYHRIIFQIKEDRP